MLDSVKVQKNCSHESGENKMLRGMHKVCGSKGFFLEPYVTSLQVSCNYTSAKKTLASVTIPKQPVPKLKDTLAKYLQTVRPFLNDEEFAKTSELAKDFQEGSGKKLQSILEKRAQERENWLEEWWINTAYLEYRDPVVIYSSPGLLFPLRKFKDQTDQLGYAARLLLAALEKKSLIDSDGVPQEMMGKNPLDMGQYKKIFGTCRRPFPKRDKLLFNNTSRHITVIHNNHFFHVDLWGEDNVLLNEPQIVHQLKKVIELSSKRNDDGIGILTSEHRDRWAEAYDLLVKDKTNQQSINDIETSIAVLCLDARSEIWNIKDSNQRLTVGGGQTIHGGGPSSNGGNRYYDKTIQFIVGADGVVGLTYEHSPAEGQPVAYLSDHIIKHIDDKRKSKESTKPKAPKLLKFNITPDVAAKIKTAKENMDKLIANFELNCFRFNNFGKEFIKSQKLSPDSFIQMAMQYAFYRIHKVPGAHYESAATRMFLGGRTETIRSCSMESINFAKTMLESTNPKQKVTALINAINSHKNYTVQALQGLGVDRHLLGLKLAAIENGITLHNLYSDVGFTRSSHMRISTSQVALKSVAFMCYGPVVLNGYATCYNPRANDMLFAASAFVSHPETSAAKYRSALEKSLEDMHNVLLQSTPSKL